MKLTRICLIFSLMAVFQFCSPNQTELNAAHRAQVLAVHDEVMPKMGQLKALEKKALVRVEEMEAMEPVNPAEVQAMRNLALELDQAYEGMFAWMRQYDNEDGQRSPEEVKAYLDSQMKAVTEVNLQMKAVLTKADSLLRDQ